MPAQSPSVIPILAFLLMLLLVIVIEFDQRSQATGHNGDQQALI
jgi:hypothetical protein